MKGIKLILSEEKQLARLHLLANGPLVVDWQPVIKVIC